MQQSCTQCGSTFEITENDLAFYKQIGVPLPTVCPDDRFMRRLNERNARKLYKRTCDLTGQEIISPYNRNHSFPVYAAEVWWSDQWDEISYGRDYDFTRPFFEQFGELLNVVPHQGTFVCTGTMQNSDFTNCAGYCKNCYMIAEADHDEDCYHSNRIFHNSTLVDCSNCYECELCYEAINCIGCFNVMFSEYSQTCTDSAFLKNCIGCKYCIGCMNQRQKEYMIFNKQLTKEEFEKQREELNLNTIDGLREMRQRADDFFLTEPQRPLQNEHNENSTGNHLYDSKNSFECYDCKDLEDCKWCAKVFSAKSSVDYTSWGDSAELMYQCAACGDHAYDLKFCTTCVTNNSNLEYCGHCTGSKDCFGCVGLRKKQNCIFNKQYSKEEYESLKKKIIEQMTENGEYGQFFPPELCPYGYNDTIAMEYFPLSKEEAQSKGYKWSEEVDDIPAVDKTIPSAKLPESIEEIPDDILNWAILCEETARPFRIVKQELAFYRQQNLPIPHHHPDIRHNRRQKRRSGVHLYKRICPNDGKEFLSTFGPERSEIVWCEECYLKEIY